MTAKADKKDRQETPLRNLVITEIYTTEALINILERKGIISRAEILDEIKTMKEDIESKAGRE